MCWLLSCDRRMLVDAGRLGPSCKKADVHDHPLTARDRHVQASVSNSQYRAAAARRRLRGHHRRGGDRRAHLLGLPPHCHDDRRARGRRPQLNGSTFDRVSRPCRCTSCGREAMTDHPVNLDKHRGMAAQKATDLRRALAEVETHARELRERESELEHRMMSAPAVSWPEAAVKARHLLNLYAASLPA